MPDLTTALGLLAVVLVLSALAAGLVARAPLSFPMLFLALGVLLGGHGLGLLDVHADDPTLEAVAVICLALVLFIDAVDLRPQDLRRHWRLPLLTTGPGTMLTIALIAAAGMLTLGLSLVEALLVAAALSSLDPVVVRDVVRDTRIPNAIRQTLRLEAGTNDVVVLPAILILIAISQNTVSGAGGWLAFGLRLFVLGPVVGAATGIAGAWAISQAGRRTPIPTEYQALYGIGLVFAAFVAGEAAGSSGFLAAFVAGFAITAVNHTLCDCFVEYGEITAEMAMLLAFILLGAALPAVTEGLPLAAALLFAVLVLAVARPVAITLVLHRAAISHRARLFIAGFGPRGLSTLLLMLLVVHAGVPAAERLLGIAGVVVAVSLVLHGSAATPLGGWYGRRRTPDLRPEERESIAAGLFQGPPATVPRITPEELAAMLAGAMPPLVLDVRSAVQRQTAGGRIPRDVAVAAGAIDDWTRGQDRSRPVVVYCT